MSQNTNISPVAQAKARTRPVRGPSTRLARSGQICLGPDVVAVLDRAAVDGCMLRLPAEPRLERKLYERVNVVLEALGGKWNRGKQAHVFAHNPQTEIEAAIASGHVIDLDKALAFFPTPMELAQRLVAMADVQPGHFVLEPSAGDGAIAQAIVDAEPDVTLAMVEVDDRHRTALDRLCRGRPENRLLVISDFLKLELFGRFDRIVANPPFGAGRLDVDHVLHMHKCLKPGGVLVSVMADGVRWREDRKSVGLRELVRREGGEFTELEAGAFAESGTDVRACVVWISKAK